jgi:hypothetical protein
MIDTKEVLIRSSRVQLEDFKNSIIWKDMKRELLMWKRAFKKEYKDVVRDCLDGKENPVSAQTHLGELYGRESAIEYILQIPDIFLQILEDNKDGLRHNKTD